MPGSLSTVSGDLPGSAFLSFPESLFASVFLSVRGGYFSDGDLSKYVEFPFTKHHRLKRFTID